MKKLILSVLAVWTVAGFAYAASTQFEGEYTCKGKEVGTNEIFNCKGTIEKTNETYRIKGLCDEKDHYLGTGIYDASNNSLAIAFINPNNANETGIEIMRIDQKGLMTATWTYLNKTIIAKASCEKK